MYVGLFHYIIGSVCHFSINNATSDQFSVLGFSVKDYVHGRIINRYSEHEYITVFNIVFNF